MNKKIIFLDIDGVLNHQDAYIKGDCKYHIWGEKSKHEYYQRFCPVSKFLLNKLIRLTKSDIVISSTWRKSGLEYLRKVWELEEMEGQIIGVTPVFPHNDFNVPRGIEIDYYLEHELKFRHINYSEAKQLEYMSKIDNYIIIDDDSDMLYKQRNHFVHVLPSPRNTSGFNQKYFDIALDKLSKNIITLNYG